MIFLSVAWGMDPIVFRVARRFLGFKYEPKETKQHKVEKLQRAMRDATGLSGGMSEAIADAWVRGREVDRLALQKNWPVENGVVEGPKGTFDLKTLNA